MEIHPGSRSVSVRRPSVPPRSDGFQRLVDVLRVARGLGAPPPVAEARPRPQRRTARWRPRFGRGGARAGRAPRPARARLRDAMAATMLTKPAAEQEHQAEEQRAKRAAHVERRLRQRRHRHRQRPDPRRPSTATRTCQAPAVIIQRCPVNSRGSSADRVARRAPARTARQDRSAAAARSARR